MNRLIAVFFFSTLALSARGQSTMLDLGSDELHLLQRLETCSGAFSDILFLSNPAVDRRDVYRAMSMAKSDFLSPHRSNVDNYNINRALSLNGEYAPIGDDAEVSRRPLGPFYESKSDLLRFSRKGFFFSANPVLGLEAVHERGDESVMKNVVAGLHIKSNLSNVLGISLRATHHYEEPFSYERAWISRWDAVPGAGSYRYQGRGLEYLLFRGYANIGLIPEHLSLRFGYDRNVVGSGIRSFFLSDFSEAAWFVSFDTKIWRLNYRNIYMRLEPQGFPLSPSGAAPTGNKFATIHHVSVNVLPWLNLGAFESVTFVRDGGFEFGYLNPVIFYRAVERSLGSPDKVSIGLDAKAIPLPCVNVYTQFLINEFTAKEFFSNKGYWANKWALQLGAFYFNAFSLKNLDLQAELNLARPYTFTHNERAEGQAIANYTHFNQALAHPLGAGFAEGIGKITYQPMPRLRLELLALYAQQGMDTGTANLGNNIFKDYRDRPGRYGVTLIYGPKVETFLGRMNLSYELRPNLFADLGGGMRQALSSFMEERTYFFHAGLRLNMNRNDRLF